MTHLADGSNIASGAAAHLPHCCLTWFPFCPPLSLKLHPSWAVCSSQRNARLSRAPPCLPFSLLLVATPHPAPPCAPTQPPSAHTQPHSAHPRHRQAPHLSARPSHSGLKPRLSQSKLSFPPPKWQSQCPPHQKGRTLLCVNVQGIVHQTPCCL